MMDRKIITPQESVGMTKYGIDVEEAEPAAILIGMHKRVVGNERKISQLSELVNSLKIELEMAIGEIEALKSNSFESCECKKRSKEYANNFSDWKNEEEYE